MNLPIFKEFYQKIHSHFNFQTPEISQSLNTLFTPCGTIAFHWLKNAIWCNKCGPTIVASDHSFEPMRGSDFLVPQALSNRPITYQFVFVSVHLTTQQFVETRSLLLLLDIKLVNMFFFSPLNPHFSANLVN